MRLGYLHSKEGRHEEALAYFKKALEYNSTRAETYLFIGVTYIQLEKYNDAIDILQKGLSIDPKFDELHFNLGVAYDKLNKKTSASQR